MVSSAHKTYGHKVIPLHSWVETDILIFKKIGTNDNESDSMTKNVGRTLFYRHMDYLMGKLTSDYARKHRDIRLYDQSFQYPSKNTHKAGGDGSIT